MQITREDRGELLDALDFGDSAAHVDTKLIESRIETDVFKAVIDDRYDIVLGTKGSGKTSIYRIYLEVMAPVLLRKKKTILLNGIETHGDPVFNMFSDKFSGLSENEFINFWKIWLISLVNSQFIKNDDFAEVISLYDDEVQTFKKACVSANIPTFSKGRSWREILDEILTFMPRPKKFAATTPDGTKFETELDQTGLFEEPTKEIKPIYTRDITESLNRILERAGLCIWVMIDRLDEIFPRRSDLEKRALRALLRVYNDVVPGRLKLKIFLRDDVFDFVTKTPEGFAALDHITARASDTLRWNRDEILHLIVKRAFSNKKVARFYKADFERIDSDPGYREITFYYLFPETVEKGRNQSLTHIWLYNHCRDGLGCVTPRDIIELLKFARSWESDNLERHNDAGLPLLSTKSLVEGYTRMSKRKREALFGGDFPDFIPYLKLFEGKKAEYDTASLQSLLGFHWQETLENLIAIGFLEKGPSLQTYKIPFVFRPGFNIKQGKAF